jgi:hypothetical protein
MLILRDMTAPLTIFVDDLIRERSELYARRWALSTTHTSSYYDELRLTKCRVMTMLDIAYKTRKVGNFR